MERGKICVALTGRDAAEISAMAQPVLSDVDVIEIRLDGMAKPDVVKCCSLLRKPLLFTNRPAWEGGAFSGSEDERVRSLLTAVELNADYIDFELRAAEELRSDLLKAMQSSTCRMILSCHYFEATPSATALSKTLDRMMDSGTHIGKIITTAHTPDDVLRVLQLQEKARAADFPLSCFCMGEAGQISRLATLYLGGYMTYACLSDSQATASGQLSVLQLKKLISTLEHPSSMA